MPAPRGSIAPLRMTAANKCKNYFRSKFVSDSQLLLIHEVAAAILLPAVFGAFGAERFLLAVADGANAIARNTRADECTLDGIGAVVPQSQVVFGGTALVAVAFHGKMNVGMGREELSRGCNA